MNAADLDEASKREIALECALRPLVEFIDGLTYEQLDLVPGLFTATRQARMALPGDHIAEAERKKRS